MGGFGEVIRLNSAVRASGRGVGCCLKSSVARAGVTTLVSQHR